jgi:hypothetical protein
MAAAHFPTPQHADALADEAGLTFTRAYVAISELARPSTRWHFSLD